MDGQINELTLAERSSIAMQIEQSQLKCVVSSVSELPYRFSLEVSRRTLDI
jgi:hypothetical protein